MQWRMGRRAGCSQREYCIWVEFRSNSLQAGIPCWRHPFPRQRLWGMLKPGTLKATYPEVNNGTIRIRVKLQSQDQQEMYVMCPEISFRKPLLTLCANQKVGLEVSRAYWAIHGDFWDWTEPENYLHRSWKWYYLTAQSHQSWRGGLVFTWLTLVYNLELPFYL